MGVASKFQWRAAIIGKHQGRGHPWASNTPPFHSLVLQSLVVDPELKSGLTPRSKKAIRSLHS